VEELAHGIDQILVNRTVELCRAGETYISKRQYVDAEIYLWQALRINPEYLPALIDMGSMKAEQGDYVNAVKYLNKALAIDPSSAPARYNLSMVYKMQGRLNDAQQETLKLRETEAKKKRDYTRR
jgi:tetratricopeptide (TPR) repeat protein